MKMIQVDRTKFAQVINDLARQGINGNPISGTSISVMQWSKDNNLLAQGIYTQNNTTYQVAPQLV